ncbi:hypothetical protein NQ317_009906 [Molorchus minor]|uniref:Uncharacterized protein n=1 Tax=Molorchus minor TaxID=1323400 RepID=A0ABQ9IQJ5_9CUCU|nr:hypothetical protein NQ317_009906 [Molorchus minor]
MPYKENIGAGWAAVKYSNSRGLFVFAGKIKEIYGVLNRVCNMDQERKHRRVIRGLFTKKANELEALLLTKRKDAAQIDFSLQMLQSRYEELQIMDSKICDGIWAEDQFSEEELINEIETCYEYKQRLLQLQSKCVRGGETHEHADAVSCNTSSSGSYSVSTLYDEIESHLRSLETLGITSDKYAAMLYPLIESCLPECLIRVYQRFSGRLSDLSDDEVGVGMVDTLDTRLKQLMKFLRNEVENEQKFDLAMEGFGIKTEAKKETLMCPELPIQKEKLPQGKPKDATTDQILTSQTIIKESSRTTKIRPVFDASSNDRGNPSLNQCLEVGPNLIRLISEVLIRFRRCMFGVVADIRKAFLQIAVQEEDRDCLRFLWVDKEEQVKIFRHRRVVFGVSSNRIGQGKRGYSLETIKQLEESFYVDNFLTSVSNQAALHRLIRDASTLMDEARMDLQGMYEKIR